MKEEKADLERMLAVLDATAAQLPDDPVLVEDWIERLTANGLLDTPQLTQRFAAGGSWDASAFGRRLIARIQESRRDWKDAVARWTRVIDAASGIDQEALLSRAGRGHKLATMPGHMPTCGRPSRKTKISGFSLGPRSCIGDCGKRLRRRRCGRRKWRCCRAARPHWRRRSWNWRASAMESM